MPFGKHIVFEERQHHSREPTPWQVDPADGIGEERDGGEASWPAEANSQPFERVDDASAGFGIGRERQVDAVEARAVCYQMMHDRHQPQTNLFHRKDEPVPAGGERWLGEGLDGEVCRFERKGEARWTFVVIARGEEWPSGRRAGLDSKPQIAEAVFGRLRDAPDCRSAGPCGRNRYPFVSEPDLHRSKQPLAAKDRLGDGLDPSERRARVSQPRRSKCDVVDPGCDRRRFQPPRVVKNLSGAGNRQVDRLSC